METMNQLVSYHNLLKRTIGLSKFESTIMTCAFFRVQNCESEESVTRKLIYKFMKRVEVSENSVIASITTSDLLNKSKIRLSWLR